jgi:hypothetical protein
MGVIHDRILNGLPGYLDKNPAERGGISLQYDGTCRVTIRHHTMTTKVIGGSGSAFSLDLTDYTLDDLVTHLNTLTGYSASLEADNGARGAASLMEATDRITGDDNRFMEFTSILWGITQPVAWALEDALENIRRGVAEMSLKTADGPWVDLWGEQYYGAVYRNPSEQDRPYAARIIREVTRWRLNGKAMEQIILEELALDATITNLHDQAWVVAETGDWVGHGKPQYAHLCFGYLAWRKYSRTTFEVLVDGTSANLTAIIERNRAAGTLPFYRMGSVVGSLTDLEVWGAPTTVTGMAGLEDVEISAAIESALIRFTEDILLSPIATSFVLGLDIMGQRALGGLGIGGAIVDIEDTAAII